MIETMIETMIIKCIDSDVMNSKIKKGNVYRASKCRNNEYLIYELNFNEWKFIDGFNQRHFKVINAKRLSDVIKETDKNKVFEVIGCDDKILVRKNNINMQSKNITFGTSWQDVMLSPKWFNYVYKSCGEMADFDKAVRSRKRFKHKTWEEYYNLKNVLAKLTQYDDEFVNYACHSKSWIIEN